MEQSKEPTGESMSGRESLALIRDMISRAKGDFRSQAFYFLLWGWIILAGSLGHFLLLHVELTARPEWAWAVIAVGVIASFVKGARDGRTEEVRTYPNRVYSTIWMVFLANYFLIIYFLSADPHYLTPLVLLLAAGSTFLSGCVLRFPPLKYGGYFIWALAIAAFLLPLAWQLLATAAAVAGGYLVPGYLLKNSGEDS
ncbi:MAG: hypothetical protein U5K31_01690 [Balneolaceae bacterium]|nr:hypothetical protein [Balneolaceae bacterium]